VDEGQGSSLLATHMETHTEGTQFCQVRAGGTGVRLDDGLDEFVAASRFQMSGRATYRLAAQKLPGFMHTLFGRAGVAIADLKQLVPHQASGKALDHLQRALGLPQDALVRILEPMATRWPPRSRWHCTMPSSVGSCAAATCSPWSVPALACPLPARC